MSQITSNNTYNNNLINQLASDPLFGVVENYLNTVKTKQGRVPSQDVKENFILTCITYKLNPSKKQIYLLGYDNKDGTASFNEIISITGQTCIASRTGDYAGVTQPRFTYLNDQIDSCSVSVVRLVQGQKCEFFGQAYFSERAYNKFGTLTDSFQKQPKTMIEKCARAVALRNAFPEELGNSYEEAEMSTMVETKISQPIVKLTLKPISPEQEKSIYDSIKKLAKSRNEDPSIMLDQLFNVNNIDDIKSITEPLASKLVFELQKKVNELNKA